MVKRKSGRNPIRDKSLSVAEELFAKAFNAAREPRSLEYKRGVMAALIHGSAGIKPEKNCPYKVGTAGFDAFEVGLEEGHRIWMEHVEATAHQEEGSFCEE
jgi:hypothetical protein